MRKIRVFQENAYLSLDYQKQDGVMFRLVEGKKGKEIVRENVEVQRGEPLMIELESFVRCAREGAKPRSPAVRRLTRSISRWRLRAASRKPTRGKTPPPLRRWPPREAHHLGRRRGSQRRRSRRGTHPRLRQLDPDLTFIGAGGPKMAKYASAPFDNWIAEAGVLGLWDVLKKLRVLPGEV